MVDMRKSDLEKVLTICVFPDYLSEYTFSKTILNSEHPSTARKSTRLFYCLLLQLRELGFRSSCGMTAKDANNVLWRSAVV